jgi:hypothetical protein
MGRCLSFENSDSEPETRSCLAPFTRGGFVPIEVQLFDLARSGGKKPLAVDSDGVLQRRYPGHDQLLQALRWPECRLNIRDARGIDYGSASVSGRSYIHGQFECSFIVSIRSRTFGVRDRWQRPIASTVEYSNENGLFLQDSRAGVINGGFRNNKRVGRTLAPWLRWLEAKINSFCC